MSMLEVHSAALQEGNAVYHEFLLKYRRQDAIVYGIVEGKDDPTFYQGLIESFLPTGWDVQLIKSGSRKNVLNSLGDFDWRRIPKNRVCFFVDRDLSMFDATPDPISENLFVTEKYSIENEAATFGTVQRILHDVLNIVSFSNEEVDRMRRVFEKNLDFFQDEMVPVMCQIILWQRAGQKPSLDNINPKDLFTFDKGIIKFREGRESLSSRLEYVARKVGCTVSPLGDLQGMEWEFRERRGKELYVRGKYILWFVIEMCLEFHREIKVFSQSYDSIPKVKITMGHANAMVLVAPRIRCPEVLQNFLKNTYGKYIEPPDEIGVEVVRPNEAEVLGKSWFRKIIGLFSR